MPSSYTHFAFITFMQIEDKWKAFEMTCEICNYGNRWAQRGQKWGQTRNCKNDLFFLNEYWLLKKGLIFFKGIGYGSLETHAICLLSIAYVGFSQSSLKTVLPGSIALHWLQNICLDIDYWGWGERVVLIAMVYFPKSRHASNLTPNAWTAKFCYAAIFQMHSSEGRVQKPESRNLPPPP